MVVFKYVKGRGMVASIVTRTDTMVVFKCLLSKNTRITTNLEPTQWLYLNQYNRLTIPRSVMSRTDTMVVFK